MKLLTALILAVGVTGCVQVQPPVQRLSYDAAEFSKIAKTGTGIVRGQAFLKTRGGDVKKAAGEPVTLNPKTSLSDQWYSVFYLGRRPLTDPDQRYASHIIETTADGDGKFEFKGVPPGDYYLVSRVSWEAHNGYGISRQGGIIAKPITVVNGQEYNYILTR